MAQILLTMRGGTALIAVLSKVMQDVGLECVESSVYLNDTSECIYTCKIYSFYQVYMMYIISVLQNVIIKFITELLNPG